MFLILLKRDKNKYMVVFPVCLLFRGDFLGLIDELYLRWKYFITLSFRGHHDTQKLESDQESTLLYHTEWGRLLGELLNLQQLHSIGWPLLIFDNMWRKFLKVLQQDTTDRAGEESSNKVHIVLCFIVSL